MKAVRTSPIRPPSSRVEMVKKGASTMQEINDRRDKEGQVATREAMPHTAVVLTLLAMLGVIGLLAAGSVGRSETGTTGSVSIGQTQPGLILVNSKRHTLYMFAK